MILTVDLVILLFSRDTDHSSDLATDGIRLVLTSHASGRLINLNHTNTISVYLYIGIYKAK